MPFCGCCVEKETDNLDAVAVKERWAWWFSGFASGPDTINGVFWSVAILYLASLDAVCDTNDGFSSGADGLMCTKDEEWNETVWVAFGGESCLKTVGLQTTYQALTAPACQAAFASYRAFSPYTCNCTSSYAFLSGGIRPDNVLSIAAIVSDLFIAFTLPLVGTWVDTSNYRRQVFFYSGVMMAITTCMGSIMSENYVWAAGLTFTMSASVMYECMFLGLGPYLPEIATDDQAKVYIHLILFNPF